MIDRVYAIHTDEECERLDAQALLGGVSDHLRHVPAQPGMRILDAGCGSGSMAREIARAAPETITVGIDLRDKYIDHARIPSANMPLVRWLRGADRGARDHAAHPDDEDHR